jgi:hypothetical protein
LRSCDISHYKNRLKIGIIIISNNNNNNSVGEEKDVLEVWATYFKELLNPKTNMKTPEETI